MKYTIKKVQNPEILVRWEKKARDQRQTPEMSKRTTRNIVERRSSHRLVSVRMRAVERQSPNPVRAAYQSAESAGNSWRGVKGPDESVTTRNVGPSDLDQNYQHGKNTGYRTF